MATKKIRKLSLLTGVGLILLSPVIGILPSFVGRAEAANAVDGASGGSAFAADSKYSQASTNDKAAAWTLARSVDDCLYDANVPYNPISSGDADKGKWGPLDGGRNVGEFTGVLVEGSGSDDAKVDCSSIVTKALATMGISATQALCDMGFTREHGSPCSSGSGGFIPPCSMTGVGCNESDDAFGEAWDNMVMKDYFGATVTDPTNKSELNSLYETALTGGMKYYIYWSEFNQGCGNGKGGGWTVTPWKSGDDTSDSNSYHLPWLTSGSEQDSYVVSSDHGKEDKVTLDGFGILEDDSASTSGSSGKTPRCHEVADDLKAYADAYTQELAADTAAGRTDASAASDSGNDIGVSCGGLFSDDPSPSPLNWIVCPIIEGAMDMANALEDSINGMLCVNEKQIFGASSSTCGGDTSNNASDKYHTAWNVFRLLAVGLLAAAGLIMIISQGMGFEIFDAYTIKKTLPRIIVAAIGISLSWQLLEFVVQLSNGLGIGVRHLIYAPFNSGDMKVVIGGGSGAIGALFGVGAAAYGLFLLGPIGILALLGTGILAIALAFFTLVLRNILVIMLLIFSPLAIAAYILPNTEKYWKLWWEWFFRALLAFPIITALIAIGHVFAALTTTNGSGASGSLSAVVGVLAYFAPYFLIPAAFRFAGGAMATIGGLANDRSRGAFDRLRNVRKGQVEARTQRARQNQLYNPSTKFGRAMNTAASWTTDPASNLAYVGRNVPGLKHAGTRVAGQIEHAQFEQTSKLFEELNKAGFNDKGFRALSGAYTASSFKGEQAGFKNRDGSTMTTFQRMQQEGFVDAEGNVSAPTSLNDLQRMSDILEHSSDASERIGGNAIHGSIGKLANLYKDPEMGKASIAGAGIMGLSAHGFANGDDLATVGNNLQGKGGMDSSAAQSIITQSQLLGSRSRPDVKAGYGVVRDGQGNFVSGTAYVGERDENGKVIGDRGSRAEALVTSLSSHDLAGAKGGAFDDLAPTIDHMVKKGVQLNADGKAQLDGRNRNVQFVADNAEAAAKSRAVIDQLYSWAGPYSQASNDIKSKALQKIDELGLRGEFDARTRQEFDPSSRGIGGAPDAGGGAAPGGGGPQA